MLILVRHGRTAGNAARLLLGRLDLPLDECGLEQAALVAKTLGAVDRVVASPLGRARQTAEAIGLAVDVDERWVELDYGELDGRPLASIGREVWDEFRADTAYAPTGGEPLAALSARVVAACEDLRDEARERDVVVVSHVSPIKAAVAWALGVGVQIAWRAHLDPASITRIAVGRRHPVLHTFNETAHLAARES